MMCRRNQAATLQDKQPNVATEREKDGTIPRITERAQIMITCKKTLQEMSIMKPWKLWKNLQKLKRAKNLKVKLLKSGANFSCWLVLGEGQRSLLKPSLKAKNAVSHSCKAEDLSFAKKRLKLLKSAHQMHRCTVLVLEFRTCRSRAFPVAARRFLRIKRSHLEDEASCKNIEAKSKSFQVISQISRKIRLRSIKGFQKIEVLYGLPKDGHRSHTIKCLQYHHDYHGPCMWPTWL